MCRLNRTLFPWLPHVRKALIIRRQLVSTGYCPVLLLGRSIHFGSRISDDPPCWNWSWLVSSKCTLAEWPNGDGQKQKPDRNQHNQRRYVVAPMIFNWIEADRKMAEAKSSSRPHSPLTHVHGTRWTWSASLATVSQSLWFRYLMNTNLQGLCAQPKAAETFRRIATDRNLIRPPLRRQRAPSLTRAYFKYAAIRKRHRQLG